MLTYATLHEIKFINIFKNFKFQLTLLFFFFFLLNVQENKIKSFKSMSLSSQEGIFVLVALTGIAAFFVVDLDLEL